MLYFMAAWTILLVLCSVIGIAVLNRLQLDQWVRMGDRLIVAEWIGLLILSISLLAVSIVLPLMPLVGAGVGLIWVALALQSTSARLELAGWVKQLSWRHFLGYFALVIAIAAVMVRPVTWVDSGLYHYGAIQWLAQYGTVTGIALIFSNLGFVSSWFALAAPFNPPLLEARVSAVANGFVLLLVVLQFVVCLVQSLRGKARTSDGFGIIFFGLMLSAVLLYSLLREIAVSPSPDLLTTFLVGIVPWSMLVVTQESAASPRLSRSNLTDPVIPLLLAAGAVTIKLTTMPLLLISSLFYLIYSRRSLRQLCLGGAMVLLLLCPLLLAGVKASGCPLYPSSAFCLDVPWAQTGATVSAVAQGTHGWLSWYGSPPAGQNPLLWALGQWLQSERTNKATAGLVGLTVVALICSVKPLLHSPMRGKGWILAIGGAGTTFLMMTAPFFRFLLPYLLLIPSLLLLVWATQLGVSVPPGLLEHWQRSWGSRHTDRTVLLASLILITASLTLFVHTHSALQLILPPPMRTVAVVQKQVNDLTYFSPQATGELCWATPLPCGFEIEKVRLRDADRGLAAGFVRQD